MGFRKLKKETNKQKNNQIGHSLEFECIRYLFHIYDSRFKIQIIVEEISYSAYTYARKEFGEYIYQNQF